MNRIAETLGRVMDAVIFFWAVFWSVVGPISFLMWCSFAYGWG